MFAAINRIMILKVVLNLESAIDISSELQKNVDSAYWCNLYCVLLLGRCIVLLVKNVKDRVLVD